MLEKDINIIGMETIRDSLRNMVEEMGDREALAVYSIISEHALALAKHARGFHSHHEGYAVLLEEVDEAWDAIKQDDYDHAAHEMSQVGAMVMRYLIDLYEHPLLKE